MMDVPNIILQQLGGQRFLVMTGAKNLVGGQNRLSMRLPRNGSKANRLTIVLNGDDTYTMRFWRYTSARLNHKTGVYTPDKETDVQIFEHVYCNQLQPLFTEVTKMYTHL